MIKPYLKLLDIYYGSKCNLACVQCDTRSDVVRTDEQDPSLENILEGIRLAREKFEIEIYSLIGGEPLLNLDKVSKIIEYIRSYDTETTIFISTNGTLLSKKIDQLSDIMQTYHCSVMVCNHFSAVDKDMTNRITDGVNQLVSKLELNRGDSNKFFKEFLKLNNPKKDPYWGKWIDERKEYYLEDQPQDEYYHNDNIFLHFRPQDDFKKNYVLTNGKPKPHATGLPHVSYKQGCSSPMCSFLIDKKLYKCAALGTLKKLLEYHNVLDDPDWQKYLNYRHLDLETCSDGDIAKFHVGKYFAIAECDMCGTNSFKRTQESVIHVHTKRME